MLAKNHWTITVPFAFLAILLIVLDIFFITSTFYIISIIVILVYSWVLWFFRDPDRLIIQNKNVLLSPADGTIFNIEEKGNKTIVYIRMYIFDCHIIRMPCSGKITQIKAIPGSYYPHIPIGKGLSASSKKNARKAIDIKNQHGEKFKVIEIAGILAYRTLVYPNVNQSLEQGERLGMIRFGSECDLHFSSKIYKTEAKIGDKVKAGKTILARRKHNKNR